MLTMARTIVSSHQCEVSEVQCNRGFDEKMYQGLIQNEGERIAAIARQIYNACALSSNVNWDLLVDNARWIISPYEVDPIPCTKYPCG